MPEDKPVGTILYQITATDRDTGLNGRLVYRLTEETNRELGAVFGVRGDSGKVTAVVKVSRILPDLRSGANKFCYREVRGPIDINNAPEDISRISQGP